MCILALDNKWKETVVNKEGTAGYRTDQAYTYNFFEKLGPVSLKTAAGLNGYVTAALNEPFTYLELGCGHAISLCGHAAVHPQGQFFGVDFMPAHIEFSKKMAESANIPNVTFIESSFAELDLDAIPDCDFIVAHGVLSWVRVDICEQLQAIVAAKLKPKGVYFVNYNAMPGWSAIQPLQMLLSQGSGPVGNRSTVEQLTENLHLIDNMIKSKAIYFNNNPMTAKVFDIVKTQTPNYLVHEFMHDKVEAFYVTEVAAHYAEIGLIYAGRANLPQNYSELVMPKTFEAILQPAKAASRLRYELLTDYVLGTTLRDDLYVRDANNIDSDNTHALFGDLYFTLLKEIKTLEKGITFGGETILFDSELDQKLLMLFSSQSQTIDSLFKAPALVDYDRPDIFSRLKIMIASQVVMPCVKPLVENGVSVITKAQTKMLSRLNAMLFKVFVSRAENYVPFMSPITGSAVGLTSSIAKLCVALLVSNGGYGKALQWILDHAEKTEILHDQKRQQEIKNALIELEKNQLPLLDKLGIVIKWYK